MLGLALSGLIVFRLQSSGQILILLGLTGICLGVLTLIRPEIGLFAIVVASAVIRVKLSTGTDSPVVASLAIASLLCAAWPVHRVLHRRQVVLLPRAVAIPGLFLIGTVFFSFLWGRVTLDPRVNYYSAFLRVQLGAIALIIVSIGLLFVGADLLRDRRTRSWLMAAVIIIGFAALPFRALNLSTPWAGLSLFGLFGLWFVSLSWGNALANRHLPIWLRIVLGGGALSWLAVQFFLQRTWISGWTPAVLAFVLITLILRPRLGAALLTLGLFALIASPSTFEAFFHSLLLEKEAQGSVGGQFGRLELWLRSLDVIRDHLALGTGPAGYALYYVTFVPDQAMSTHSNYLDILAEMGIPGLLSFVGLLVGIGAVGFRTFRTLTNDVDRAACAAVLGALPAVAYAMTLGDWVIPFVYNQTIAGFDHSVYTWLMFAMLCGLAAQRRYPIQDDT